MAKDPGFQTNVKRSCEYNVRLRWWLAVFCTSIVSFLSRLYNIHRPNHVCWDETHFGKFANWYINRTFFFDVHPPLGKMLIGLVGAANGYNGTFPFEHPGDEYVNVPYIEMRFMCCTLGSFLPIFAFLSVWELTLSLQAAIISSILFLTDTANLTISRFILLDPILLFFIMLAVVCWLKFLSHKSRPFSLSWWFFLSMTGVALACSLGVKFVGLFVVLHIGLSTAFDLWNILGDLNNSMVRVLQHFFARVLCLICLPIVVYLSVFVMHFLVLNRSGTGDGHYSSAFQSQLIGNPLHNSSMPEFVAYGAVVTIKNHRVSGAYLHSHWQLYPAAVGAPQGQVTGYSYKDVNNEWIFFEVNKNLPNESEPVKLVRNGDLICLRHKETKRNLHSHRIAAPVTRRHFQVTTYATEQGGDANDFWRVDVPNEQKGVPLRSVRSAFRLIHANVGCALHSHSKKYPKWGFEQLEVTCNPSKVQTQNMMWNVEQNVFPKLPNISLTVHSPSFFEKIVESHAVMHQSNAELKPPVLEASTSSRPWMWPLSYGEGTIFSTKSPKIILIGNYLIWWTGLALIFAFPFIYAVEQIREVRGYTDATEVEEKKKLTYPACWWLLLGWWLNYAPFWTMSRILYYHHYLPSFQFELMFTAIFLDYLLFRLYVRLQKSTCFGAIGFYHFILGCMLVAVAYSFYLFSPLTYGLPDEMMINATGGVATLEGFQWLPTWL